MKRILIITSAIVLLAAACNKQTVVQPAQNQEQAQGIVVEQPVINQEVQLPITVKGYINGNGWAASEGVAGIVQVFDANNKAVSAITPLKTTTDWMKFPVYFEATVGDRQMMSNLTTETGVLVFKSSEEKDGSIVKEFRLPIKFTDATANWKIYTNTKYSYEVKYPNSWKVSENISAVNFMPIGGQDASISLYVYDKSINEAESLLPIFSVPGRTVNTRTNVTLNGIDWVKLLVENNQVVQLTYHNGKTYAVQYATFEDMSAQIVSTFKFTK